MIVKITKINFWSSHSWRS